MRPTIRIISAGFFGFLTGAPAAAAEIEACVPSADRTIAVRGTATIRVPPDRASFLVGVASESDKVAQAFEMNNAKVQALLEALKRKGIAPAAMQTSSVQITPRRNERGQELPGFRVSNVVTVTLDEPKRAGELLQTAVSAGANRVNGLRFFVANTAERRKRGLELAYEDAEAKAEVLAALSEQALGDVVCISETPAPIPYRPMEYAVARSASVPIETGTEEVSFALDVVFELLP